MTRVGDGREDGYRGVCTRARCGDRQQRLRSCTHRPTTVTPRPTLCFPGLVGLRLVRVRSERRPGEPAAPDLTSLQQRSILHSPLKEVSPLRVQAALVGVVGVLVAAAQPASAAFPGLNGKIAFSSDRDGDSEIYTMNADGSGQTKLTDNAVTDA